MEALQTSLGTAFTNVNTNVMSILGVALPAAIGIVATILAVKIGIRFFKSVSSSN